MPAPLVSPLDLSAIHVPPHFRCPISLELMRDPVTVSTGQTYDRSSIDSWVATGNTTCPVTRAPLDPAFTPIPNHTLRRLIQDWCVANRSQGVERIPTPVQPANPETVRALMAQAQQGRRNHSATTSSGPVDPRVSAVRRLRALARESDKSRALVAEHRSDILALAFRDCDDNTSTRTSGGGGGEDDDAETSTTTTTEDDDDDQPPSPSDLSLESIALASALPLSEDDSASIASRPRRLSWLSRLLRHHPCLEARASAAGLIEAVSAGTKSPDLKSAIGAAHGVMDGLVALLALTTASRSAARAAIKALFSLCLAKQNRDLAVSSGAATALVRRIASSSSSSSLPSADLDRSDLERALATVELLCRSRTGVEALVLSVETASMSASAMVSVMAGRASDRAAEHAAGALLSVCAESGAARSAAVDGGVVSQLLLMVQGGCTERGKRKAQALLKLLWSAAAWAPPQQRDGHRVEDDGGDDEDGISLEDKIRRRHQPHGKDWSVAADTGVFLHHHHHHHHNPPHRQPQQQHAAALLR